MNGILLPVIAELGVKISVSCHQINCKRSSIENTHFSGDTKTDSRKIWELRVEGLRKKLQVQVQTEPRRKGRASYGWRPGNMAGHGRS